MTRKEVINVMRQTYGSDDYTDIYNAVHTLAAVGLIDRKTWDAVTKEDYAMFEEDYDAANYPTWRSLHR